MTYQEIKERYRSMGFIFNDKPYQVNPFGIRNKDLTAVDYFNDILGIAYLDSFKREVCLIFAGTTKPGLSYLGNEAGNPDGTFIMCPGQFLKAWTCGFHHANDPLKKYPAYVQNGSGIFRGWRDNNKDGKFDFSGKIYTNSQGVNGHHAGMVGETKKVGLYSMGCQVVQDDKEQHIWLGPGQRHEELYGVGIDYTLFQD